MKPFRVKVRNEHGGPKDGIVVDFIVHHNLVYAIVIVDTEVILKKLMDLEVTYVPKVGD